MKRTMTVMFVLAVLSAWSFSATAQQDPGTQCGFDPASNAAVKVVTYPYLTASGDWWGGFAVINNGPALLREQLCFVASTHAGRQLVAKGTDVFPAATAAVPHAIAANGMFVDLIENLNRTEARWKEALILGVYTNAYQRVADNKLYGFGMVGNTTSGEAQGYNALRDEAGLESLWFRYVPGADTGRWWRGLAIVNNRNTASGNITIRARYNDGTTATYNWTSPATIPAHGMTVNLLENLFPSIRANQAAQIIVTSSSAADRFLGFAMFGNTATGEAQGMLGETPPAFQ